VNNPVCLIHTSDLHLDRLGDRRAKGLQCAVDIAISSGADGMLVAGDLFDHNRVKDDLVVFAASEFQRFGRSVVILPGNHDPLVANSVYHRDAWLTAPNVQVFREEGGSSIHLPHLSVSVWGRPATAYGEDSSRPLDGAASGGHKSTWRLAIAHGYLERGAGRSWASFQMTASDVTNANMDYIALGDSHAVEDVGQIDRVAYYSGAPSSGSHTVLKVELRAEPREVVVSTISTRNYFEQSVPLTPDQREFIQCPVRSMG